MHYLLCIIIIMHYLLYNLTPIKGFKGRLLSQFHRGTLRTKEFMEFSPGDRAKMGLS